jgi:hypothetical protein
MLMAAAVPPEPPRYVPGATAGESVLRSGGTERGEPGALPPQVLAPELLGVTLRESPTLYWLLPEATSFSISVTVVSETAAAPLLEATLAGPHAAGIHRISLEERGIKLPAGTTCQWFVAVVRDPEHRSRDLVSSAGIRYTPPDAALASKLMQADGRTAHIFAESGFWYDAFDQIARWSSTEPGSALLRRHQAALLEQVGLRDAAARLREDSRAAPPATPASE